MSDIIKHLNMPSGCPLCGGSIEVKQIQCTDCGSEISGSFKTDAMLGATGTTEEKPLTRKEILDSIERGEMSVKDATFILNTRK